jgi:hypothetical protein
VPIKTLKVGEVAVIVDWPVCREYEGLVVVRYYDNLIGVGTNHYWSGFFKDVPPNARIKILPKGTGFVLD